MVRDGLARLPDVFTATMTTRICRVSTTICQIIDFNAFAVQDV